MATRSQSPSPDGIKLEWEKGTIAHIHRRKTFELPQMLWLHIQQLSAAMGFYGMVWRQGAMLA